MCPAALIKAAGYFFAFPDVSALQGIFPSLFPFLSTENSFFF